jgi:hypothetical protein
MTAEVALTALIGLASAALGYIFNEIRHQREIRVKMIEIAVGILAADLDKTKGLRNWAVDTLAHYSRDVPLTDDAKTALRSNPLPVFADAVFASSGSGSAGFRSPPRGLGAHGDHGELTDPVPPPQK